MPEIFGKYLSRQDYMRRVGDAGQAFGIRAVEYAAGKRSLIRAYEVEPASGLRFTVAESKGLDLLSLSYRGVPFSFITKASISSPWIADEQGMAYRGSLGAGFMYTAGLSNVGGPCEEGGFYHYAHGALKNLPAENVSWRTDWDGDDCTLRIGGDVRDAQFFGRNLLLHREISARVGEKRLFIEDAIENQGFSAEQLMLLYHMNLGFPILDADAVLYAPVAAREALTPHTRAHDADYARMVPPIDNHEEYLHALTLKSGADGRTLCAVYNPRLNLGLYLRYNVDPLRYLIEWKCMSSGDYALGVLPSTCKPLGRSADRACGEARALAPFEPLTAKLEIGVIDGAAELGALRAEIDRMRAGG